jgi:hypothetical protein
MQLVFTLSLFVSATLLFLVQPMFARMALPLFGGTPGVWNTCMVFYQAALLAGYGYAHLSLRQLGARRQALCHLLLLAVPWLLLPIGIAADWRPPVDASPTATLLMLLLTSVGLPFFVVTATAPMLQAWFSATGHRSGRDPYFLYAASNLGSLLGLLGYPLVVEPHLTLAQQARAWSIGYAVLSGLIAWCAILLWRAPPAAAAEISPPSSEARVPAPSWLLRFRWLALALVPSSLMLGVTTHIATDIASVPMLWVIPLALYLLSFVLVFARRALIPRRLMLRLQPLLILFLSAWFFVQDVNLHWPLVLLHLAVFFVTAMVCHGELAATRPDAGRLTEFYLWMSLGGVLGGLVNAILAPWLFSSVFEYPLMLVAACMLRPSAAQTAVPWRIRLNDLLFPSLLFALLAAASYWLRHSEWAQQYQLQYDPYVRAVLFGGGALVVLTFSLRPLRLGLGVAALLFAAGALDRDTQTILQQTRSFFGVIRVKSDGNYHSLEHGTTRHGMQNFTSEERRGDPLTYYGREGPLGQVFSKKVESASFREVAVIGLGAGTTAAYGLPQLGFTFYEIDPAVKQIAEDTRLFTYLADSRARQKSIVLGDARLMLAQAPAHSYDLIIFDAFSSDSIPLHLVTREALQLYLEKLTPDGLLLLHISNRYMDLAPILGRLAQQAGLKALIQSNETTEADRKRGMLPSTWVLMGRDDLALAEFQTDSRWRTIPLPPGTPLWTDDFSNILSALRVRKR